MSAIDWHWLAFDQLTAADLYQILKLRQDVFIVEQQCIYSDLDNQDQKSIHLLARRGGDLVAYLRIIPSHTERQETIKIGRVATAASARGEGLGRELMTQALMYIKQQFPTQPVALSAQQYLSEFYQSLGFTIISDPYDDEGITHLDMRLDET